MIISFFIIVASLLVLYIIMAFVLSIIPNKAETVSGDDVTIFILSNGVHTDIVMPVSSDQTNWSKKIKFDFTESKDSSMNYVAVGWGDKGFYLETPTWGDLKFRTAFKATFGLGTSAIHATFYDELVESDHCVKLKLTTEQYSRLVKFIDDSFTKDKTGNYQVIKTNANYGRSDAFYEAKGSYSLFRTCNSWSNNALKACGQKASLWTPLDKGIFYHYN